MFARGSFAKERWLEREDAQGVAGWRGKSMAGKRQRAEPTNDWDTLVPLFWWPEQ